jgi:hypothetical protein
MQSASLVGSAHLYKHLGEAADAFVWSLEEHAVQHPGGFCIFEANPAPKPMHYMKLLQLSPNHQLKGKHHQFIQHVSNYLINA